MLAACISMKGIFTLSSRFDRILLETAILWSEASRCERLKVGSVVARDTRIISTGFNGTLPGEDNRCEDLSGVTKETVVHAEQNALMFCAKHGLITQGCSLYSTIAPCPSCAKLIVSAGLTKVVYIEPYRNVLGLELLDNFGIHIEQFGFNNGNLERIA